MSDESLAAKVSSETPWWATAPIWLAAGIVGVPSLLAIMSGYYIASSVSHRLAVLDQYGQSMLYQQNEHQNDQRKNWSVVLKFIDDDLRCQYVTCLNSAKTDEQRTACVSPKEREREYGISVEKK